MYLIIGLGNPGKSYENTRHNIGFHYIDLFAKENDIAFTKEKFHGLYGEGIINQEKIVLVKPQQYMNLSGEVVKKYVDFYKVDLDHLLIIHDDLDLPLGTFRLKQKGSSGGHNGLKDIEKNLGTDLYKRLKIGISHDRTLDTKDYVLGAFSSEEQKVLKSLEKQILLLLNDFITKDFNQLMSEYNQK